MLLFAILQVQTIDATFDLYEEGWRLAVVHDMFKLKLCCCSSMAYRVLLKIILLESETPPLPQSQPQRTVQTSTSPQETEAPQSEEETDTHCRDSNDDRSSIDFNEYLTPTNDHGEHGTDEDSSVLDPAKQPATAPTMEFPETGLATRPREFRHSMLHNPPQNQNQNQIVISPLRRLRRYEIRVAKLRKHLARKRGRFAARMILFRKHHILIRLALPRGFHSTCLAAFLKAACLLPGQETTLHLKEHHGEQELKNTRG